MIIPSIEERMMKNVHLCNKHAPPDYMLGMVTSIEEFRSIVSHYCMHGTSSALKGGCSGSSDRRKKKRKRYLKFMN